MILVPNTAAAGGGTAPVVGQFWYGTWTQPDVAFAQQVQLLWDQLGPDTAVPSLVGADYFGIPDGGAGRYRVEVNLMVLDSYTGAGPTNGFMAVRVFINEPTNLVEPPIGTDLTAAPAGYNEFQYDQNNWVANWTAVWEGQLVDHDVLWASLQNVLSGNSTTLFLTGGIGGNGWDEFHIIKLDSMTLACQTDTFSRTSALGWGTGPLGPWLMDNGPVSGTYLGTSSIVSGKGYEQRYAQGFGAMVMAVDTPLADTHMGQLVVQADSSHYTTCVAIFADQGNDPQVFESEIILGMGFDTAGTASDFRNKGNCIQLFGESGNWQSVPYTWGTGAHNVKWWFTEDNARVKAWPVGSAEPFGWMITVQRDAWHWLPDLSLWIVGCADGGYLPGTSDFPTGTQAAVGMYWSNIECCGVPVCQTDDFNRTVPIGMGAGAIGGWYPVYGENSNTNSSTVTVNGNQAVLDVLNGDYLVYGLPMTYGLPLELLIKGAFAEIVAGSSVSGFSFDLEDDTGKYYNLIEFSDGSTATTVIYGHGFTGNLPAGALLSVVNPTGGSIIGGATYNVATGTVLSGPYPITRYFQLRWRIEPAVTYAKVWWDGATEPAGWQLTNVVDSTQATYSRLVTAMGNYNNAGNESKYLIDSITVCGGGESAFIFDSFNRTVAASSWGTSDYGLAWAIASSTNAQASVNGTTGLLAATAGNFYIDIRAVGAGPWQQRFTMMARVITPSTDPAYGWSLVFSFDGQTNQPLCSLYAQFTGAGVYNLDLGDSPGGVNTYVTTITKAASEVVFVKWQVDDVQLQGKAWLEGTVEPNWQVSWTMSTPWAPYANSYLNVNWSSGYPAQTIGIDYIMFIN